MYKKTTLANGVRLVTETVPHVHTASLGIWIDVGSRDEDSSVNGAAHFLEHMFFKGTRKRTAQELAIDLDRLGGTANAFTAKDTTCIYATVLHTQLPELTAIFGEMLRDSLFDRDEIARERQVIMQEMALAEDTPEDLAGELFEASFWGEHPLARPILGDPAVVAHMDRGQLREFLATNYQAPRLLVSAAGQVDHEALCKQLKPLLSHGLAPGGPDQRRPPKVGRKLRRQVVTRPLEQAQIILGVEGINVRQDERFALVLLNTILGGNMSSRLFSEVREKRGLAYSIATFNESYTDCGLFGVSAGVSPPAVSETLAVIAGELARCGQAVSYSKEEFGRALAYAKASLYLSAENLEARMSRNARNEFYFNRPVPLDEVVTALEAVTVDEVAALGARLFARPYHATVLGPIAEVEVKW
ncbi:MAG: pitrilysin family protein [Thermodesulfobacteriota bacterium]